MKIRFDSPFTFTRRFTRFGLNLRFVACIEWLRRWPNWGPLLQTEHLAIGIRPFEIGPRNCAVASDRAEERRVRRGPAPRAICPGKPFGTWTLRYHARKVCSKERTGHSYWWATCRPEVRMMPDA